MFIVLIVCTIIFITLISYICYRCPISWPTFLTFLGSIVVYGVILIVCASV
ncbi:hypothetical protein [Acetilactobacillus jinshanensis]|uniref:hypothetical protein n=1 Tax=Acetilactobacillus jinshanensis TaxID=1720083 RepID=UPI0013A63D20|nr:hypothetical protein [Acetilactobacillus jinshanensis]URL60976.1 hypothetical protein HGK75_02970 [uncultured bacterium]